jgi:hypothetical protein
MEPPVVSVNSQRVFTKAIDSQPFLAGIRVPPELLGDILMDFGDKAHELFSVRLE